MRLFAGDETGINAGDMDSGDSIIEKVKHMIVKLSMDLDFF